MINTKRNHSFFDTCIENFDQILRTLTNTAVASRENPANLYTEVPLSKKEQYLSAALMRVNHTGEVCAQALYQGQALTTPTVKIKATLQQNAIEENDHLMWCNQRIQQLNSHVSYLNPVWYFGSLIFGMIAGICGDRWNLGFVNETEQQVGRHLEKHLQKLPIQDQKSRAILQQMHQDELHHANIAITAGAAELPTLIKELMRCFAKMMTTTAYYV